MATTDLADLSSPLPPPPRDPHRRGRPYRPEVIEAVRALLGTGLRFGEIAARTGLPEATVGRWSRRLRFAAWEGGARDPVVPGLAAPAKPACENPEPMAGHRSPAMGSGSPLRGVRNDGERPAKRRRGLSQGPHPPETRAAARAMVEGTRLGLERIALELGIGTATLSRWVKRGRWGRPAGPAHAKPARYRVPRGRPYAADAVEKARDLVTGTLLPQARIAAQAGVSQATVSIWIRKRGWVRPTPKPWSRRFAASVRTAPLAESGSRRGRPYHPAIVAEARRWYEQTELSTRIIAARVRVTPVTVARWAKARGWTRPRDIPNPDGSPARRRQRSCRRS